MYSSVRDYNNHKEEYDSAISAVLESGNLIMGSQVKLLEQQLEKIPDYPIHCITMGSGTDALLAALLALDVGPGSLVITTPFTWISTAEVIALIGAIVVFIDIERDTYCLDPILVERWLDAQPREILERVHAIIPVSLYGHMADMEWFGRINAKYSIPIIEDAAQSFGATQEKIYSGMPVIPRSIGCVSFFPTKPLGCYGDGGACFTEDPILAEKLRAIRLHGKHTLIGFNGRLDTIQAAVLLVKLKYFRESLAKRQQNAAFYNDHLNNPVICPTIKPGNTHAFGQYTVRISGGTDKLQKNLAEKNIPFGIYYSIPLFEQPVFQNLREKGSVIITGDYPVTRSACNEVISLPVYPEYSREELQEVIETVNSFF